MGFSAGAIRALMGDIRPIFNVTSLKNRDCVVFITWEEGVLEETMVGRVLDRVKARLDAMI